MTSCPQPRCTGTILDGYCDVCGSPAGAAPFVSAEVVASAASPALVAPLGVCPQPGCAGAIVDGYCDVCGSPAGAAPFVSSEAAASAGPADDPGLAAVPAPTPAPTFAEEEIPTQRIPRVTMPEQLSTQEMADPAPADPRAVAAQKIGGKKEFAEGETDGVQHYRRRVEEAQLPDDIRKAALSEIGKLEATSDQSPQSGDIRIWLDTILELPWSTKTTDWIDLQGSHDVEVTLRKLMEPAVADMEEADTGEVGSAVADTAKADTAPAARDDGDTVERLTVLGVPSEGRHPDPPFAEQQEFEPAAVETEESAGAEVEPAVADIGEFGSAVADIAKADPAPAARDDDDTVELLAVPVVPSEGRHPDPPFAVQQEVEPAAVEIEESASAQVGPVAVEAESDSAAEGDTAEVEPVAVDVEEANRTLASPHDDDTEEMSVLPAAVSGGRHSGPEKAEQQAEQRVDEPVLVRAPAEKRRFGSLVLLAAALAALLIGALLFGATRDGSVMARSVPTGPATATPTLRTPTSEPSDESTDTGGEASSIQLEDVAASARPFQTVRIEGAYRGGADTFLQVQREEGDKWVDFPLPTRTDESGQFITYVEFGQAGRYRLRLRDPDSGVTSTALVLVVSG